MNYCLKSIPTIGRAKNVPLLFSAISLINVANLSLVLPRLMKPIPLILIFLFILNFSIVEKTGV